MRGHRDRARVRDVGQQRAEQHDELDAERLGQVDHDLAEAAPAHRGLGAGEQHEVARRAGHARGVDLELRPLDLARRRRRPAGRPAASTGSRTKSSGSITANGSAPRLPAEERERRRRGVARVVPALEGADQRRGPEAVGSAFPAQRLHRIHRTASGRSPSMHGTAMPVTTETTVASLRAGDDVDAVFACSRKDRLQARSGTPYLALELRDRTGAIAGRGVPRRRRAGRALRARRPRAGGRPRRALPRRAPARGPGHRPRRGGRPGGVPAGRLPRPRRARRLPRAPGARGPRPGLPRAAGAAARRRCPAGRLAPRAVHARRATTPTSAGCSSTRSRWPRSRSNAPSCTPV